MQTKVLLKYNDSEKVRDSLTSQICSSEKEKQTVNLSSAIVESLPLNKKMTSQDKSSICVKNSQTQKSSKTLEADSTTKEKDCNPFYNDFCKEISSQLLSHIEIDCADLDSNLFSSSLSKTEAKSWFLIESKFHPNKNSQKTCWQFFTSSHAECTDFVGTNVKSRKIRIYPTQQQKITYKQWFGVSRKFYNASVEYYNNDEKDTIKWIEVSNIIFNENQEDYVRKVPYQIKKIAVKDCYTAFRTNCEKVKETGEGFELSFRTKKDPKQSCYIPKSAFSENGIYYTIAGNLKMKEMDLLKNCNWQDLRLVKEYDRWYLCIPVKEENTYQVENQNLEDVVALDPGVRTFMTYFSEEGHFGKIGEGCFKRYHHYISQDIYRNHYNISNYAIFQHFHLLAIEIALVLILVFFYYYS